MIETICNVIANTNWMTFFAGVSVAFVAQVLWFSKLAYTTYKATR